jgi:hypothetical protein
LSGLRLDPEACSRTGSGKRRDGIILSRSTGEERLGRNFRIE